MLDLGGRRQLRQCKLGQENGHSVHRQVNRDQYEWDPSGAPEY